MIITTSGAGAAADAVTPLQAAFDRETCAELAGADAFGEGVRLALLGRVESLRIRPTSASGVADDDGLHEVLIEVGDDGPRYRCTCGEGAADGFCRHAVALALTATGLVEPDEDDDEDDEEEGEGAEDHRDGAAERDRVRAAVGVFLTRLPRADLVELLLDLADDNEPLAEDLWEATVRWHRNQTTT
jgi:uncharacterized Zn finger protein